MRTAIAPQLFEIAVLAVVADVRDFVTRSKCWRDSKDGVLGVSMGRTHNGFGSFANGGEEIPPASPHNFHSGL